MRKSRVAGAVYSPGTQRLIPSRIAHKGLLASKRTPLDRNLTEVSWRTMRSQEQWFEVPVAPARHREWEQAGEDFYRLETKLIWAAFDAPERIPVILRDEALRGRRDVFTEAWLDTALHWVGEARYWRCIGIQKPFLSDTRLRAHAWASDGRDVGRVQMSAAMWDAVRDLERAAKRREAGLEPNYVWDQWGPAGNVDGSRTQYLPRFRNLPVVDPDGVEVTDDDVSGLVSHEQLRERYAEFIDADPEPFVGKFLSQTHGGLGLADLDEATRLVFTRARGEGAAPSRDDRRVLLYVEALPELVEALPPTATWEDVVAAVAPVRAACDRKVDAARMLHGTTRSVDGARAFYEEKCGLEWARANDKTLTAATTAHLQDMKAVLAEPWGAELCLAFTDQEKHAVLGDEAFTVWRCLEDVVLDRRRRQWASRFAGAANEEKTLDYMLQNFGKRTERPSVTNQPGAEFDREQEPIGRKVQRRVLDSDKASASTEGSEGRFFARKIARRKVSAYDKLHEKQFSAHHITVFTN